MLIFPHAKINLGLNVVRKRADGYHDIETVMVPIPLTDALEVIMDPDLAVGQLEYTRSGLDIPGLPEKDLCVKAHQLLSLGKRLPGLRMHLHKRVPLGAGLGGGSSDGTHALMAIDRLLQLQTSTNDLHGLAAQLGSDCPFFLNNSVQLATGRGELLRAVDLNLQGHWLLLVNPGVHVPTSEAYAQVIPSERSFDLYRALTEEPMERWRELAPNIMEEPVVRNYAVVGEVLQRMKVLGAVHYAMSGSGATVFGIFREQPPSANWPHGFTALALGLSASRGLDPRTRATL
jgi:4-diphosphocytidyl-2-C-methyl-D-erythritol kinase